VSSYTLASSRAVSKLHGWGGRFPGDGLMVGGSAVPTWAPRHCGNGGLLAAGGPVWRWSPGETAANQSVSRQ